jgi:DNA-binding NarL/FixJ family response regulator
MSISLLMSCRDSGTAATLCANLVHAGGGRIAGEATDRDRVLSRAASTQPGVLLLEHSLTEEEKSWQLLARLRELSASTRVLLLCDAYTHLKVIGFLQRGVDGCLLKTNKPELQARAVIAVHGGETWFGRTALLQALRSQIASEPTIIATAPAGEENELLTQREREILGLIGNALTNKEIARRLKISDNTVKTHLHRIYVKLHQSGRYKAFVSNVTPISNEYPSGQPRPTQ